MDDFWCHVKYLLDTKCDFNVDKYNCTVWHVCLTADGYGRQKVLWPSSPTAKIERAHRLAYMVEHKFLPSDMHAFPGNFEISHLCHNRSCINVKHLVLESKHANNSRKQCKVQGFCNQQLLPHCLL